MKLQIYTKSGALVDQASYEVLIPTSNGTIAVYDGHTPIITDVVTGVVAHRTHPSEEFQELAVFGGIAEITSDRLRILVDDAAAPEGISEADALAAQHRAQQLMAQATDQRSLEEARRQLSYSTLKLHVATRKKRRV